MWFGSEPVGRLWLAVIGVVTVTGSVTSVVTGLADDPGSIRKYLTDNASKQNYT